MSAAVESAYPTIFDLRAAHSILLKRLREGNSATAIKDDVEGFILRARATGALLDADTHRDAAQGLIDYWSTTLVRNSISVPETTLADFNPLLAPTLPEELCPYVGLEAFREKDSKRFFGRTRMLQSMLAKLAEKRVVAVFGPSGSGKSSVVLGGLLPMLKSGALEGSASWRYLGPIVPGSDPLANLAACFNAEDGVRFLRDPRHLAMLVADGPPACVVIDQFEELFTLCEDDAARSAFAANLVALLGAESPRHRLILTMRSDYDQHLAKLPELQKLIENADVRAMPLNAAELREAIENAAEPVGLKLESGLVDRLIADVLGEPAALPLLQFTLLRLWQERDHNRLTVAAYNRLGGGRVALARTADALYDSLIPQDQFTMRRILLRMVRPGAGASEVTSSRVRRAELMNIGDDPDRVVRVLQKLVDARLVRSGASDDEPDAQVEVAHEALVRNWPRLVTWLDELRGRMTTSRRFETLADEWERFGRRSGLLVGAQLDEAERWLASEEAEELGVKPLLRTFVEASRREADQQERMRRRLRNARVAAVVLLIAMAFGLYAVRKNKQIREQTARFTRQQREADLRTKAMEHERREADSRAKAKQVLLDEVQTQKKRADNELKKQQEAMKNEKEARDKLKKYTEGLDRVREGVGEMLDSALIEATGTKDLPSTPVATAEQLGLRRRLRPIQPGASISGIVGGTACCVVLHDGDRYLATAGIVIGLDETKIFQPQAGVPGSALIGAWSPTALYPDDIKLAPDVPATNVIPNRGLIKPLTHPVKVKDPIYMLGSASGLVKGVVVFVNDDAVVATIKAKPEDIGAPLLTENNELAGIVWVANPKLIIAAPADSDTKLIDH